MAAERRRDHSRETRAAGRTTRRRRDDHRRDRATATRDRAAHRRASRTTSTRCRRSSRARRPATSRWRRCRCSTSPRSSTTCALVARPHDLTRAAASRIAADVRDSVSRRRRAGRVDTTVPKPGQPLPRRHLQGARRCCCSRWACMALALSGFLVVTTVSALMAQQVRQVGIMKAVGGRADQIVADVPRAGRRSTALLAVLVGVPLGAVGGHVVHRASRPAC